MQNFFTTAALYPINFIQHSNIYSLDIDNF